MNIPNRIDRWTVPLALVVACAGVTLAQGDRSLEQQLMEADRKFARATAERGLDGWMSFMAPDAVRFEMDGKMFRGTEAIREHDSALFRDPGLRLTWEPTDAAAFGDDHGFTRGRYRLQRIAASAPHETLGEGVYITFWRRGADGWKVILDTGVADDDDHDQDDETGE